MYGYIYKTTNIKNNRIIATGYNGSPSGFENCIDAGCLREKLKIPSGERAELCRGIHAEENAIIQCALHGISCENAILYSTTKPCSICIKTLSNAKIKRIIYKKDYKDNLADELIKESNIEIEKFENV